MKITNKHDLPAPLYAALKGNFQAGDTTTFTLNLDRIALTKLLMPYQQSILLSRHDQDLEEDAVDRLWMLYGGSVHHIMEAAFVPNVIREVPLTLQIEGATITMKADLLEPFATLSDYKVTSVWSAIFGDPSEYADQLNGYSLAFHRVWKITPERLQVVLIFRDWAKSKANDAGYPKVPFLVWNIPSKAPAESEAFFAERVRTLRTALTLPDDKLPECTPKERWTSTDTFAVMKKGNKKASRVLDTERDASDWIAAKIPTADQKDMSIVKRPGNPKRCMEYCPVNIVCHQLRREGIVIPTATE